MFARKRNHVVKPPHVYKLHNSTGSLVSHPNDILGIFVDYYQKLFSKSAGTSGPTSQAWFADLALPTLSDQQLETLNVPCTTSEMADIIKSLKSSTAPGPDGYTTTYFKKFCSTFTPKLVTLYKHILKGHNFPPEMLLANMSLIPKPHKDHSIPQNFHPISVINNDLKIFSRLLADRLASVITSLISPNQTGFIPGRQIT